MIYNAHVDKSVFFGEFNENIFRKLRSHNRGPGVHVHQGLDCVHNFNITFLIKSIEKSEIA